MMAIVIATRSLDYYFQTIFTIILWNNLHFKLIALFDVSFHFSQNPSSCLNDEIRALLKLFAKTSNIRYQNISKQVFPSKSMMMGTTIKMKMAMTSVNIMMMTMTIFGVMLMMMCIVKYPIYVKIWKVQQAVHSAGVDFDFQTFVASFRLIYAFVLLHKIFLFEVYRLNLLYFHTFLFHVYRLRYLCICTFAQNISSWSKKDKIFKRLPQLCT